MGQDFTKQHSADADIVMNFLSDTAMWKKHSHMMDRAFYGLPITEDRMKQRLNHLFKDDFTITLDHQVLYFLKIVEKEHRYNKNDLIDRLFQSSPTDKFELEFLNTIRLAKKLKDVVDWIQEAKQTGYAYQDTTSNKICMSK